MILTAILALAALISAAVAAPAVTSIRSAPPKSWEFTIDFSLIATDGVTFSYNAQAVVNGTHYGHVYLVGNRSPVSPATPAFFTGNKTNAGLFLDLSNDTNYDIVGVYSVSVPHVNSAGGHADYVLGSDQRDYLWEYSSGEITHQSQAALNSFYLCDDTINGVDSVVLKYGAPSVNGTAITPPPGCYRARLFQNFNIPGGAKLSDY